MDVLSVEKPRGPLATSGENQVRTVNLLVMGF